VQPLDNVKTAGIRQFQIHDDQVWVPAAAMPSAPCGVLQLMAYLFKAFTIILKYMGSSSSTTSHGYSQMVLFIICRMITQAEAPTESWMAVFSLRSISSTSS
jgi:hypothetical protein